MTAGGLGISADSESYLVAANRFTQHRWGESVNPYWPPLYPLNIAAIKAMGLSGLLGAARIVSVFSFIISIVTVYLLGLQLGGKRTAHLSAISCLVLSSMVYLYCFCWSETLYIMLSLLFLFTLTLFLKNTGENVTKYLILSGIFSGLGTITRFIGFSLIGAGIVSIIFLSHYHPPAKKIKKTLVFVGTAVIPVFLYYLICFHYYGLTGKKQFPSSFTFIHQLIQLPVTVYHDWLTFDLKFWNYVFFFKMGHYFFWLGISVLLFLVWFMILFFRDAFRLKHSSEFELKSKTGVFIYVVFYIAFILIVSSTIDIDPIGSRFIVPVYPFFLLLVFSMVPPVSKISVHGKPKSCFLGMAILCLAVFWSIQLLSIISIHQGINTGSFLAMEHPGNLNRGSMEYLKQNLDSNDYILSNVYRKLTFIWPRQEPYFQTNEETWEESLNSLVYEASQRTVYVLICTGDYTPQGITVADVDQADNRIGLFAWKKIFGNDYLYKTKHMAWQPPPESQEIK